MVDMPYIEVSGLYYGGMLFVSIVADRYIQLGRITGATYAAHYAGVWMNS